MERIKNILWTIALLPSVALAESIIDDPSGGPVTDAQAITDLVERLQGIVFMAAAAIAVAMIIWGGTILILAGGNEERVAKGKKILTYSIGGLLLIALSYTVVLFFVSILGGSIS